VKIFIAKEANVRGAASELARKPFDQAALVQQHWMILEDLNIDWSNGDYQSTIRCSDVLVIVTRGEGCNYIEDESNVEKKVKELFQTKTWGQIRREKILVAGAEVDPLVTCS